MTGGAVNQHGRRRETARWPLIPALALVLMVTGCGGGGAAGSQESAPPETSTTTMPAASGKDTAACVKFEALSTNARVQLSTNEQTEKASRADLYAVITGEPHWM